jgi:hypothetical protein
MSIRSARLGLLLAASLVAAAPTVIAHHAIAAKFDETKSVTLNGIVTDVDWKNPHVHILINVKTGNDVVNWAVELESPIALQQSGWASDTVQVGDTLTVQGITARNGSKQAWARSVVMSKTGRQVLMVRNTMPPAPLQPRPAPKGADGKPRLGAAPGGVLGYWAYPSATVLKDKDSTVTLDASGLLKNIADADKVAPMQPWALALYKERQRRFLQDDPTYLNCKPPGGPRQFQQPEGVQFVEDPVRQRIFLLLGGGNSNYRILWMDGRGHKGQVGGDDDNPLYYGRAVAQWEGDTLVVDTRGFNEDFWFTNGGLPHTEQLRLVERFTRSDFDTLRYEVTIEDPGAYTRNWSTGWTMRWVADQELPKHFCQDNRP